MCEEKRTDDRPAEGGALNSGRLAPPPFEEIYLQRINDFQLQEGSAKGAQESDLPIVVRDGNTDHTAKDQAGMQRGQSTHATRGTTTLDSGVSRTLSALGIKAEKESKHRFRSLARLLDQQLLREAFRMLKRRAAPGIDGVTYGEYAENLEENLLQLETRLKQGTYRAQPVKRRWIAKTGSNKMRPLGIPVLEDTNHTPIARRLGLALAGKWKSANDAQKWGCVGRFPEVAFPHGSACGHSESGKGTLRGGPEGIGGIFASRDVRHTVGR